MRVVDLIDLLTEEMRQHNANLPVYIIVKEDPNDHDVHSVSFNDDATPAIIIEVEP